MQTHTWVFLLGGILMPAGGLGYFLPPKPKTFAYKDCLEEKSGEYFQIHNFSISPDPVVSPGNFTVNTTVTVKSNLTGHGFILEVTASRIQSGEKTKIPCLGNFGSCRYDFCESIGYVINGATGWCDLKDQIGTCKCLIPAGTYTLQSQSFSVERVIGMLALLLSSGQCHIHAEIMNDYTRNRVMCSDIDFEIGEPSTTWSLHSKGEIKREILSSTTPSTVSIDCRDKLQGDQCFNYDDDKCFGIYAPWAKANCPLRCGYCIGLEPPCVDQTSNCSLYSKSDCPVYPKWARYTCRKFCDRCKAPTEGSAAKYSTGISTTAAAASDKNTTKQGCRDILQGDQCYSYDDDKCFGIYSAWAFHNCPLRCGYCKGLEPPCVDQISTCFAYRKYDCARYPMWARYTCRKFCDRCNVPTHAVNGGWSPWIESNCTGCGPIGTKVKTRACILPPPLHGGKNCSGKSMEIVACKPKTMNGCTTPALQLQKVPNHAKVVATVTPRVNLVTEGKVYRPNHVNEHTIDAIKTGLGAAAVGGAAVATGYGLAGIFSSLLGGLEMLAPLAIFGRSVPDTPLESMPRRPCVSSACP